MKNVKNYDDVEELNCFFLCLECNIYCHCWMIKIVMQAAPVLTVKLIALQMLRLMMKNVREPKTVKMNWPLMNIHFFPFGFNLFFFFLFVFQLLYTLWMSLLYHVCKQHEMIDEKCAHDPIADDADHTLPWFDCRDKDFKALQDVVLAQASWPLSNIMSTLGKMSKYTLNHILLNQW